MFDYKSFNSTKRLIRNADIYQCARCEMSTSRGCLFMTMSRVTILIVFFWWSFTLRRLFLFKIINCEFVSESQNNPKAAFYQQATNGAGLSSVASSRSYTVDASPPVKGRVSEITSGSLDDIDFQVLITT